MSEAPPVTEPSERVRCSYAGHTDVGRQRKHNEDHILLRPELGLFVVADGMGGHNAGDVASKLATTSLGNFYEATRFGEIAIDADENEASLSQEALRLSAAVRKANHDVFEISSTYQQHHGMGSTVVAAYLSPYTATFQVAHVGDSRCYRLRDGQISQLTRDHSLVNDALAMKPDLTEDELSRLPKNIITRALGMKEAVKVDLHVEPVRVHDIFLLCSDGLSGMVSDEEMLQIVGFTDDLNEACELLVSLANEAGGTDNITAVLVRVDEVLEPTVEEMRAMSAASEPPEVRAASSALTSAVGSLAAAGRGAGLEEPRSNLAYGSHAGQSSGHDYDYDADYGEEENYDDDGGYEGEGDYDDEQDAPHISAHPTLDGVLPSDVRELIESGAEVDISSPPSSPPAPLATERCRGCGHQLYAGNQFCVECGTSV